MIRFYIHMTGLFSRASMTGRAQGIVVPLAGTAQVRAAWSALRGILAKNSRRTKHFSGSRRQRLMTPGRPCPERNSVQSFSSLASIRLGPGYRC
jgi:hypothetical protein